MSHKQHSDNGKGIHKGHDIRTNSVDEVNGKGISMSPPQFKLTKENKSSPKENIGSPTDEVPGVSHDAPVIQRNRDPSNTMNFTFPLNMGVATNYGELNLGLLGLSNQFRQLSREIVAQDDYVGNSERLSEISDALLRTIENTGEHNYDDPIDLIVGRIIQSFLQDYMTTYNNELNGLKSFFSRQISQVQNIRPIDEMTPELAEAQRAAFENGNESALENIKEIIDSVKSYNAYVHTWGSRVSSVNARVRGSTNIQRLISASEGFGEYMDVASNIVTAMNIVSNATSGRGSSTQQTLNRFQAGLDAIDLGLSFVKAVPVLGSLWSNYYYPAATACISAIGRIATIRDRNQRLLHWIGSNWNSVSPPRIPAGAGISFMGGATMFNFMWRVFMGNYRFSQDAEDFFMDHIDSFNAVFPSRMRISGNWNPFVDNHIVDFESRVIANKERIWLSLYGADLPFPGSTAMPGTVAPGVR